MALFRSSVGINYLVAQYHRVERYNNKLLVLVFPMIFFHSCSGLYESRYLYEDALSKKQTKGPPQS